VCRPGRAGLTSTPTWSDRPSPAEIGAILAGRSGGDPLIGIGATRTRGPAHRRAAELGVPDDQIARVHRPIGLNIGSRTPPEIAVATLAGLIADRNGRPGGFDF
jgi:hypothetical protein